MSDELRPKGLILNNNDKLQRLRSGMISDSTKANNTNNFELLDVQALVPYKDHCFNIKSDQELDEMAESIKMLGLLQPIIVRPLGSMGNGKYEILAGHNRWYAAQRAGFSEIMAKVMVVDDATAELIMLDTNLKQRLSLSPMELAKAYAREIQALKDKNLRQEFLRQIEEEGKNTKEVTERREIIALRYDTSPKTVSRYLRLNQLIAPFAKMVDDEQLSIRAGEQLSFLSHSEQEMLFTYIDSDQKLSEAMAESIRSTKEANGHLSEQMLKALMPKEKIVIVDPYKSVAKGINKFFKKYKKENQLMDPDALQAVMIEAAEKYLRSHEQKNEG